MSAGEISAGAAVRSALARVLSSPPRLGFLLDGGFADVEALYRYFAAVLPPARTQLERIAVAAESIPNDELRRHALYTLRTKAFHLSGACVLGAFLPSAAREHYIEIVAPLEAVYDFLDTLCDRDPRTTPPAFRQLHVALADALDPHGELHDYYRCGPPGEDGGYLRALVIRVRRALRRLAGHESLREHFEQAIRLYADHQTFKHLPPGERETACVAWHRRERALAGDLSWWEFAAAAGSQFHVYAPLFTVFTGRFEEIGAVYDAYFPAVCALHVLLDSFIDRAEDRAHGELNWIDAYASPQAFRERAGVLAKLAREKSDALPSRAHLFVLRAMLLFYLSHPRVYREGYEREAISLLRALRVETSPRVTSTGRRNDLTMPSRCSAMSL